MSKILKIFILVVSITLFVMQSNVQAKYVFYHENTIADVLVDRISPIVEGVTNDAKYNENVTITYYDNVQVKSAIYYYNSEKAEFNNSPKSFESGKVFSEEGYYKIVVTDNYDNITIVDKFLIDKTPPEIKGIEADVIYTLPPEVIYYDKYGIEKIEIKEPEKIQILHQGGFSNRKKASDRTENSLSIDVLCNPKDVIQYEWYIKEVSEKTFTLSEINLQNRYTFNNLKSKTQYNIYCVAITKDKAYMSNIITATTLEVKETIITEITDEGYKIKIKGISDKYVALHFATWTEKNGQDDLRWAREKVENKECSYVMNYDNHNQEIGAYNTHIYGILKNEAGMEYIQGGTVWIQKEEPEYQIEQVAGKTEITVTDTAGNVSKEEYYVDKVIKIDYSKATEKYSYLKMKQILENKMESYNDETKEIKIKQSELDKITKLEITDYIGENEMEFLGLKYFRNLEYLDISGSTSFNEQEIQTLDKLKYLDISKSKSTKIYNMSFLNKLHNLEYLNTTATKIENEEIIDELESLLEWKN